VRRVYRVAMGVVVVMALEVECCGTYAIVILIQDADFIVAVGGWVEVMDQGIRCVSS